MHNGIKLLIERSENKHSVCKNNYILNPKHCKQCDAIISYERRENKFCSRSCAAFYNNKAMGHKMKRPKQNTICVKCGSDSKNGMQNMCRNCYSIKIFKEKAALKKQMCPETIKRYLLLTRGHICEKCKLSEWNGLPISLDSHHEDGDYLNNNDENLKLLCKNCHSQTDNYGSKNKGNGSERRRVWHTKLYTSTSNI